jgi:putative DNA-invertase from lambdoid prophage Rac
MRMGYAVAYLSDRTEEQTVSNRNMALKSWASQHDCEIIYFFEDSAVSGSIPVVNRKAFQEMLELIKTVPVDAVLVYNLSSIGRTFRETLDTIRLIEEYAPLISCSPREIFLQTTEPSIRKLMMGILTWAAQREGEMHVQRTKDGMIRAKDSGKLIGRPIKKIDKDVLIRLLAENIPKAKAARTLGVSKTTLYKKLSQIGKRSNHNISQLDISQNSSLSCTRADNYEVRQYHSAI